MPGRAFDFLSVYTDFVFQCVLLFLQVFVFLPRPAVIRAQFPLRFEHLAYPFRRPSVPFVSASATDSDA